MNNNMSSTRAIEARCKGVFEATTYISIGTKEKPLVYPTPEGRERSAYKGKNITCQPMKGGKVPREAYMDGKYPWVSDGDKYIDRTMYIHTQKEKKKGFGSGDFRRKDEFSNTIRTGQYRHQLDQELKCSKAAAKHLGRADILGMSEEEVMELLKKMETLPNPDQPALYDRINAHEEGQSVSKISRDSHNPTMKSYDRNFGQRTTANMKYGYKLELNPHSKPENARIPFVRTTFYRGSGVPLKWGGE